MYQGLRELLQWLLLSDVDESLFSLMSSDRISYSRFVFFCIYQVGDKNLFVLIKNL